MMGAGIPRNKSYELKINVLGMIVENCEDLKKRIKLSNPTHALPHMPSPILKFLKAIWMPYMGPYLKTIICINTGKSIK